MGMTPEVRKKVTALLEAEPWFSTLSMRRKRAFLVEMDNADPLNGAQVGMIAPHGDAAGPALSFILFTPRGQAFRIPFPAGFFAEAMNDVTHEINRIQHAAGFEAFSRETELERAVRLDVGAIFARFDIGE